MDYRYGYYDDGFWAVFMAAMGFWMFLMIAVVAVICIALWKVFEKAGEDGWKGLVPFLNMYTISKIAWGNGWYFLLMFASPIPLIGWLIAIGYGALTSYKLAKSFGKETAFAAGLYFLPPIFLMILGFGSAQYRGIYVDGNYYNPNYPPQGGFPAPWDMLSQNKQPAYQSYQGQPANNASGYQGQPMNNAQGYQGQPMNQPQGFQNQPANQPQNFQSQPVNQPQGFQNQPVNHAQGYQNQPMHQPQGYQSQPANQPQGFQSQPMNQPQDNSQFGYQQSAQSEDANRNQGV